jgi:ABC-type hemin transport system substrate-binding protein
VIAVDDRVLLSFGARTPSLVAALREIFGSVERE